MTFNDMVKKQRAKSISKSDYDDMGKLINGMDIIDGKITVELYGNGGYADGRKEVVGRVDIELGRLRAVVVDEIRRILVDNIDEIPEVMAVAEKYSA